MIGRLWSLAELLRSERWPAGRIADYQERRLVAMLRHAVTAVPYYRGLGIDPASLRTAGDLARFPVLQKADVQRLGLQLLADGVDPARCFVSRTSGSTGQPTDTYFCARSWALQKGPVKWRRSLTGGLALPERVLVVGEDRPAPGRAAKDAPGWPLPVSVQRLSVHRPMAEQVERVLRWRPTTLYAYPSWYVEFLDVCEHLGRRVPAVRRLFTSSELLTPATRARIELGFAGQVYDVYGSTEFKEVAAECAHGRRHLIFETTYVETLESPEPGGTPALALTTLVNRAMPLLRYAIGDLGRLESATCPCGRAAPALTGLRGRMVEFLVCADGRRVSPYVASTIIEQHPAIARYQLLQEDPGTLLVRYVRRAGRVDDVPGAALRGDLAAALGAGARVSFEEQPRLERASSGKHRLLIRGGVDLAPRAATAAPEFVATP
jgi:phenylacetate-CoA ligase